MLHYTCAGGSRVIAEFLVARGVNVHVRDRYGETALHIAASHGKVGEYNTAA